MGKLRAALDKKRSEQNKSELVGKIVKNKKKLLNRVLNMDTRVAFEGERFFLYNRNKDELLEVKAKVLVEDNSSEDGTRYKKVTDIKSKKDISTLWKDFGTKLTLEFEDVNPEELEIQTLDILNGTYHKNIMKYKRFEKKPKGE